MGFDYSGDKMALVYCQVRTTDARCQFSRTETQFCTRVLMILDVSTKSLKTKRMRPILEESGSPEEIPPKEVVEAD